MLTSTAAHAQPPLDEVTATRRICARGPSAAVARALRLKGDAAVTESRVLPNPSIVAEHQRILTGSNTEHETLVGLEVELGLGGGFFVQQDAADARRTAAIAEADATLFEQALAFRQAYATASIERARAAVLAEGQRELEELTQVIAGLAKGGEAAGYDRLRQETQARVHGRKARAAQARADAARKRLEAWIDGPVTLPRVKLVALAGGATLAKRATSSVDAGHPRIRSLEATADAAALEAEAAERSAIPNLGIFAGYRNLTAGETGHGFAVGLTVPLTFFDRGQGRAARAEAERTAASAMAAELKRASVAQTRASLAELGVLEAETAALDDAAGKVVKILEKARILYVAGEMSIAEVLDALEATESVRLARIDHAEDLVTARLALMRARGRQFHGALDSACGTRRAR